MFYPTTFCNKRSHKVRVWDGGRLISLLDIGEEKTEVSNSPTTEYARYSRVTYLPGGKVEVKPNKDWVCPYTGLTVELDNRDGCEEESFMMNNDFITAMLGIPKILPVDITDPLARYEKIIWEKKPLKFSVPGTDYLVDQIKVVKTKVPRPDKEWAEIEAQLKAKVEDDHRREMEKRFGRTETTPEQA